MQPPWVYDLITSLEQHEAEHGHVNDGYPCFEAVLAVVPKQERDRASAIAEYHQAREAEATYAANTSRAVSELTRG